MSEETNWEQDIICGIETCARLYQSETGKGGIPGIVQMLRDTQGACEEKYFESLESQNDRHWAAVRLVGYYNMLAAFEAAVKGDLNGKTAWEFLQSAWAAYRYGGDVKMFDVDYLCTTTLFPNPEQKTKGETT